MTGTLKRSQSKGQSPRLKVKVLHDTTYGEAAYDCENDTMYIGSLYDEEYIEYFYRVEERVVKRLVHEDVHRALYMIDEIDAYTNYDLVREHAEVPGAIQNGFRQKEA